MKKLFSILILSVLLAGCTEDDHVFIYDPVDPRLPQYSEEGANTAGAYVDGAVWVAAKYYLYHTSNDGVSEREELLFATNSEGTGTLMSISEGTISVGGDLDSRSVGFYLADYVLSDLEDLFSLNGKEIILDGENSFGQVSVNDLNSLIERQGKGKLFVRHVEWKDDDEVIISGTFGFDFDDDLNPTTVYSGRFDFEVDETDFIELFE